MPLTPHQHRLLTAIVDRQRTTGASPSYDELAAAMGLRSKSGITRLVHLLEERGYLRRRPGQARYLEILRLPDDVSDAWLHAVSDTALMAEMQRRTRPVAVICPGCGHRQRHPGVFVDCETCGDSLPRQPDELVEPQQRAAA